MSSYPPKDPLGPDDPTHYYYYDGRKVCDGNKSQKMAVIFISNIEKTISNPKKFCTNWYGENDNEDLNSWSIILGKSSG